MDGITFDVGDMEVLCQSVGNWSYKNFNHGLEPSQKACRCANGMAEELGELIDVSYPSSDLPKILDAIGDICVYSLDMMFNIKKRTVEVLVPDMNPNLFEVEYDRQRVYGQPNVCMLHAGLSANIGRVNHHVLKMDQCIRVNEDHLGGLALALCHVWRLCYRLAAHYQRDLNDIVRETVEKVTKRDWINNPSNADEVADADGK